MLRWKQSSGDCQKKRLQSEIYEKLRTIHTGPRPRATPSIYTVCDSCTTINPTGWGTLKWYYDENRIFPIEAISNTYTSMQLYSAANDPQIGPQMIPNRN